MLDNSEGDHLAGTDESPVSLSCQSSSPRNSCFQRYLSCIQPLSNCTKDCIALNSVVFADIMGQKRVLLHQNHGETLTILCRVIGKWQSMFIDPSMLCHMHEKEFEMFRKAQILHGSANPRFLGSQLWEKAYLHILGKDASLSIPVQVSSSALKILLLALTFCTTWNG